MTKSIKKMGFSYKCERKVKVGVGSASFDADPVPDLDLDNYQHGNWDN